MPRPSSPLTAKILRSVIGGVLLIAGLLFVARPAFAQQARPPVGPAPGASEPTWTKTMPMSDGRTFVTDGALAMDAAIARPTTLPKIVLPSASASLIEKFMTAPFTSEVRAAALTPSRGHYATPDGVLLNRVYVEYFRRIAAQHRLRFRVKGAREPVVAVLDGQPIAVLMPIAQ